MTDLTLVTGIWDLGRERAPEEFARPFEHYRSKFAELLDADVPMVVFGDESLRAFVMQRRAGRPTDFRLRPASEFRTRFDFRDRVQAIRNDPDWRAQAAWLARSPQATLDLYNPMVMSKMFMLHDASCWNPFGTSHFAWMDGAITHTVPAHYFTRERVLAKVEQLLHRFFFVSFPYTSGSEVHGFTRDGMRRFCGTDSTFVCRGGFFGGHVDCLHDVNTHYYELLSSTLHEGLMGTEESIFTIMAYEEPELYARYQLQDADGGLLWPFFEHVSALPAPHAAPPHHEPQSNRDLPRRRTDPVSIQGRTLAAYILTFNAPDQLEVTLSSWAPVMNFDALYVLDHSTDPAAQFENAAIARRHGATILTNPNGNGGICGGRQFVAEHFDASDCDYCLFLEDDMQLNAPGSPGECRNGFRLSVPDPRQLALTIMEREAYDFLKLSFTEFFGDNRTQFAWYNVPQAYRQQRWPHRPHLPAQGLDPDAPTTLFAHMGTVNGVSYLDGEVYYCNWPHVVSKAGNRRMFLETKWDHPYEQTWMSHMYQLTVAGKLRPAVLLASVVTHHRFHHYEAGLRREN